ncbi:MAG: hypothetical protein H8E26_00545 [FCB group bacterium]|nr:hypothetical protein [FCB group bacterium]MBL7123248.1 hypothetical protein [Candidatus Neomarinimicrobiota bacterium]
MKLDLKQHKFTRSQLVKHIAVFLIKTGAEAILDVIVMPVALIAGLLDFIAGPRHSANLFYKMMDGFQRVDEWIDQFGMLAPADIETTRVG